MNKYFVIYSSDPYLLARFSMELQMEGMRCDEDWNSYNHPFTQSPSVKWLLIGEANGFEFHNHDVRYCSDITNPTRFWLTEKNYLEVLGSVLK